VGGGGGWWGGGGGGGVIVDYFLMVYNLDVKSAARLDLIYI